MRFLFHRHGVILHTVAVVVIGFCPGVGLLRAGEMFEVMSHEKDLKLVYQIPRKDCVKQPEWILTKELPVPLTSLCANVLRETIPSDSPDAGQWRVEHVAFWPFRDPNRGRPVPEDLRNRWCCLISLSCYKDYTGEWWKRTKRAVVLLDGTVIKPTPRLDLQ